MKKIKNLILVLALFMCFNRCEKNQVDEGTSANPTVLTVEQARTFIDEQKMNNLALKSGNSIKQTIEIKANWEKAKSSNNEKISVVETEILAMGQFGFSTPETMDAWKATGNDAYLCPMSRLVVIKDKKNGQMYSFIMSIAANKQYMESKKFKLAGNTYLKREKDLTGYVLYHSLSGDFVNGWVYCDGQISYAIKNQQSLELPVELKSAQLMLAIYSWQRQCSSWQTTGVDSDGDFTVIAEHCHDVLVVIGYFDTGGGDGGSDGGSDGSSNTNNGGTTGGYDPTAQTTQPPPCNCLSICPICHKCKDDLVLKSASTDCTPWAVCEHPDVVETDNFLKYPCVKNTLQTLSSGTNVDLKNFKINPTLTASILSLFKMNTTINLQLDVLNTGNPDINATTSRIDGTTDYKITFNSSYLNTATDLSVARTFIHEVMHAYLLYKFDRKEGEYSSLIQLFRETGNSSENYLQHAYIADNLVPTVANNLFEWCRNSGLYVDYSYCAKMAWAGLIGVPEYETNPNKSEIEQININEKLNNNEALGRDCN